MPTSTTVLQAHCAKNLVGLEVTVWPGTLQLGLTQTGVEIAATGYGRLSLPMNGATTWVLNADGYTVSNIVTLSFNGGVALAVDWPQVDGFVIYNAAELWWQGSLAQPIAPRAGTIPAFTAGQIVF